MAEHPGMGVIKEYVETQVDVWKDEMVATDKFVDVKQLQGAIGALRLFWDNIDVMVHYEEEEEDVYEQV